LATWSVPVLLNVAGWMLIVWPVVSELMSPPLLSVIAPPNQKLLPMFAVPPKPATVLITPVAPMVSVPVPPFISTSRRLPAAPSSRTVLLSV
jgi:hypothetical protein